MDPRLAYWTAAMVDLVVLVGLAVSGVRAARRGRLQRHRRRMRAAASLVVIFLASYPLKLALLGREDLAQWSEFSVGLLRLHEACVACMLIAGAIALRRARPLRASRLLTGDEADPEPPVRARAQHRLAGRIALIASLCALASALIVWAGIVSRG